MIDGAPEVMGLSIDLHEDLIEVPLPLRDLAHEAGASDPDLAGEHGSEPVDPKPHAFMANIDSTFVEEVLNVPQ